MTANDSFDRRLSTWLQEEAQGRVSDHLAEVLVTTRATRQRPGWASLERWLPVTSMTRPRTTMGLPVLLLALVALLVLAAAIVLILGVGRPTPVVGPPTNGRIVFVDGAAIVGTAADGSDRSEIATLPEGATNLALSPDGKSLAFLPQNGRTVEILSVKPATEGQVAEVQRITLPGMEGYGSLSWSPSGDRLAVAAFDGERAHLFTVSADGSSPVEIASVVAPRGGEVWWPAWSPDGAWLAVAVGIGGSRFATIQLVRPDGSELNELDGSIDVSAGGTISWSPDAAVQRLLYVANGNRIAILDAASGEERVIADGFWPTWSPTGDRISYWHDGTRVVATGAALTGTNDFIAAHPPFAGACQDHPELAGRAFCGPAAWSPDGTRLIATEVTGNGLLSLRSDGAGEPVLIDLGANVEPGTGGLVAWQRSLP